MTFHSCAPKRTRGSFGSAGSGRKKKTPAVSVSFDPELFECVAGEAEKRGIPFAAVVRQRLKASYRGRP